MQIPSTSLQSSSAVVVCSSPYNHSSLFPFSNKLSFVANAASSSSSFPSIYRSTSVRHASLNELNRNSHLEAVRLDENRDDNNELVSSSSAVASAIQNCSSSPIEFVQMIESLGSPSSIVLPSPDFRHLCSQQLDLFRRVIHPAALLSVYVRPAGGYVMDRLELRRVACHPGENTLTDIVILVGNFTVPTGLRAAEAAFSTQPVHILPESRAIVLPMIKRPFVVGFLVAEFPVTEMKESFLSVLNQRQDIISLPSPESAQSIILPADKTVWDMRPHDDEMWKTYDFSTEQMLMAIDFSNSLALAYVMDQKAMLLQQSSWQTNVRISALLDQIRGPFSSIRTLSKMLSTHVKKNEIANDIVEDILVQGNRISDTLQELQDAVYLTKANIMRFNEEALKRLNTSDHPLSEAPRYHISEKSPTAFERDMEMPMPPLKLAPLRRELRPCSVSEVLKVLVDGVRPLARKQRRDVAVVENSPAMQVAIDEPALRQSLSNLIEGALLRTQVGGKVEILSSGTPSVGALVVIEDDGPDMHFMTQMHSLAPYGDELLSRDAIEDNMAWNFVAGLAVSREILESYGCVLHVISPRHSDGLLGCGGTRIELWLPCVSDRIHEL